MKKIENTPRYQAVETLMRVETQHSYANLLLNDTLNSHGWSAADRGLFTELVYGTVARQLTLSYAVDTFLAKKAAPWVKILLETAFFQMVYLDKVPDHAIINESVEIAKVRGHAGIAKLVNAVLRNLQRRGMPDFSAISDPLERLSIEVSLPKALAARLVELRGLEGTKKLGESLLVPARSSARLCDPQLTVDQAVDLLNEEGIKAEESRVSPVGIIARRGAFAKTRLFREGKITIQDESSMLVAPALQVEPSHHVLDACAAPGGKTTHIAQYLDADKGGKVTALDIHAKKAELIRENAARLHETARIEAICLDARQAAEKFAPASFDRILVDAPCSGLGLMRRKPDIKYQKTPADFVKLPKIQREILESVCALLKSSGIMIYSTCTILPEENQEVVRGFLADHPEFVQIPPDVPLVKKFVKDGFLTLFPDDMGTDGFFISCLQKREKANR